MLKLSEDLYTKLFNKQSLQIEEYGSFFYSDIILNNNYINHKDNNFISNYVLIGQNKVALILFKGSGNGKKEELTKKYKNKYILDNILDKVNSIINYKYIFISSNLLSIIQNNNSNIYNKILSKNFDKYIFPKNESKIIINININAKRFQINEFTKLFFHCCNDFNLESKIPLDNLKFDKDNYANKSYQNTFSLIKFNENFNTNKGNYSIISKNENNKNSILFTKGETEFKLTGLKNIFSFM